MRKSCLLFAILVAGGGFTGCSDSAAPKELGPLTDSSIVFTALSLSTTPYNKLYGVLPDGTGLRMLTTGPEESIHPRWSRDGEKIAYVVNRNNPIEVWVMAKDQTDAHAVATGIPCNTLALLSWSSTGDRILAYCGVGDGSLDVINVADKTLSSVPGWGGGVRNPDWSPIGDQLIYGRLGDVYVANLDGSGETLVVPSASEPVWSPDGAHIAFVRSIANFRNAIFVANADGTGIRQLSFPPDASSSSDNSPSWSHDGTQIVFERLDTNKVLHVVAVAGGGDKAITPVSLEVSYPSW
jgi:Tol biopolymer transport system component